MEIKGEEMGKWKLEELCERGGACVFLVVWYKIVLPGCPPLDARDARDARQAWHGRHVCMQAGRRAWL